MSNLVDFDTWWKEFLEDPYSRCSKHDGRDSRKELINYLYRLEGEPKEIFVDGLDEIMRAGSEGCSIALDALVYFGEERTFDSIFQILEELPDSDSLGQSSWKSELNRGLAKSESKVHRKALEDYLLRQPIGAYWSSVPWALWPSDPPLFGLSWVRFLKEASESTLERPFFAQSFLARPEALQVVRDCLCVDSPEIWQRLREIMSQYADKCSWVHEETLAQVREICNVAS